MNSLAGNTTTKKKANTQLHFIFWDFGFTLTVV